MTTTSPRLVTWENGTDLVIELPLASDVPTVWAKMIDQKSASDWFAEFTIEAPPQNAGDGESNDEPNDTIVFDLGETQLHGEVLSYEPEDHVLVELDDFGVLGVQLIPIQLTDGDATLLIFTQSAPDEESARLKAADFGPMWDTHLRLFAKSLGLDADEIPEPQLLETYADLELEDSLAGDDDSDGGTSAGGTSDGGTEDSEDEAGTE